MAGRLLGVRVGDAGAALRAAGRRAMRALHLWITAVAVGLLFVACNVGYQQPFAAEATCKVDGGATWKLERARDCSFYEQADAFLLAELSQPSAARLNWTPPVPVAQAQEMLSHEVFWVHDATGFQCQDETNLVGGCELWGTTDAEVTRSGAGALHEMLHAWDEARGVSHDDSFHHVGWEQSGWTQEGNAFYWYQDGMFAARFGADGGTP